MSVMSAILKLAIYFAEFRRSRNKLTGSFKELLSKARYIQSVQLSLDIFKFIIHEMTCSDF